MLFLKGTVHQHISEGRILGIKAMSKAYSVEEIRSLYESSPEKLQAEYKSSCKATTDLAAHARASIAARDYVPKNRVQAYIHDYAKKYVYTNRYVSPYRLAYTPLLIESIRTQCEAFSAHNASDWRHRNRFGIFRSPR